METKSSSKKVAADSPQTSIRLDPDLQERLREAVHSRRTTRTAAIHEGLELWLNSELKNSTEKLGENQLEKSLKPLAIESSPSAESKWPPDVQRFVLILRDILGSNHPRASAAIRQNLEVFDELIRRARGEAFDANVRKSESEAKTVADHATRPPAHRSAPNRIKGNAGKGRGAA